MQSLKDNIDWSFALFMEGGMDMYLNNADKVTVWVDCFL